MAKAVADDQVQLRRRARRRLIGAIALVTLIAVILPWILETEPRPSDQEIAVKIPSPDSGSFTMRVAPAKSDVPQPSASGSSDAAVAEATAGTSAAEGETKTAEQPRAPSPAQPEVAVANGKSPAAEPKKRSTDHRDTHADAKQFVVQIAALADAEKARSMQKELAAKGLKSYTERVKTASGEVTRVRIGPYPSKESAEQGRAKLKALGYEGNVTPR
jgi:DedD protein